MVRILEKSYTPKERIDYFLRGYFTVSLVDGKPVPAIAALGEVAKIEGKNHSEVVKEYQGIISEIRSFSEEEEPDKVSKTLVLSPESYQEFLDKKMEEAGFIWDKSGGEYRSLEEETTEEGLEEEK